MLLLSQSPRRAGTASSPPSNRRRPHRFARHARALGIVAIIALGSAACGDDDTGADSPAFGPLAVLPAPDLLGFGRPDAVQARGVITIGDKCVTVEQENGAPIVVIWYEQDVVWHEDSRSITFHANWGAIGDAVEIHDGDHVVVGGYSTHRFNDTATATTIVLPDEWLQAPDPSCSTNPADATNAPAIVTGVEVTDPAS